MIGKLEEGGRVRAVYCHWGGSPDMANNGGILALHWDDPAKLDQLLDMGSLSSLGEEFGEFHPWNDYDHLDWCSFHQRDWRRGPEGYEALTFPTDRHYISTARGMTCEYAYMWTPDRGWLFVTIPQNAWPLPEEIERVEWQNLIGKLRRELNSGQWEGARDQLDQAAARWGRGT